MLILISLLLEFEVISIQKLRLSKIQIPKIDQQDHSFVFIVPSHNCSDVTKKTLDSIFLQTYKNFRVIYIDDGSSDFTYEIAKEYLDGVNPDKLEIQRFEKMEGAIERLYLTVQSIPDNEIVVYMKGNSWLLNDQALEKINDLYKKHDVWFVYANHLNFRTQEKGVCSAWCLSHNCIRRKSWGKPKLKTFYASLFKKIKLQDLFFRGQFITDFFDQSYLFPLMEMAYHHVAYIPEPLCAFIKRDVIDQERACFQAPKKCLQRICASTPYSPLKSHPTNPTLNTDKQADIVVFSRDRPLQLYALLESTQRYIKNYKTISVIYYASNDRFFYAYEELKDSFPDVHFILQKNLNTDFEPLLKKEIYKESTPYILFSVDDVIVKDEVDLKQCIEAMENFSAYHFSLGLGKNIDYSYQGGFHQDLPFHLFLEPGLLAWQIDAAPGEWSKAQCISMTLYRRDGVQHAVEKFNFKDPLHFEKNWTKYRKRNVKLKRNRIALAFETSKVVGVPLGLMKKHNINFYSPIELLNKFELGLKIHIDSLEQIKNTSTYIEYLPIFVKRNVDPLEKVDTTDTKSIE